MKDMESFERFAVLGAVDNVINIVNKILSDSKQFPISVLQLADAPTFGEIKEHLIKVDNILDLLYNRVEGPDLCQACEKAKSYIEEALDVVNAILNDDEQGLKQAIAKLDKRSFL